MFRFFGSTLIASFLAFAPAAFACGGKDCACGEKCGCGESCDCGKDGAKCDCGKEGKCGCKKADGECKCGEGCGCGGEPAPEK